MTGDAPYFAALAEGPLGERARWVTAADGIRLRVVLWPLDGARATVLILTGRTEHAEKYGPTAAALAAHGFASATIDWRGQGLSQRLLPDRRKGHVGQFTDYQRDLAALSDAADAAGLPATRHLLSHSMGGAIALRALMDGFAARSAVFSAPMWGIAVPGGHVSFFRTLTRALRLAGLGDRYAPPPATGPVCYAATAPFAGNTLTTDAERFAWMRSHFAAHPDLELGGPTLRWLGGALDECAALRRRPSPAVPALVFVGTGERVIDIPAVLDRMARWPGGRLERIAGAEHEVPIERPEIRTRFIEESAAFFATAKPI